MICIYFIFSMKDGCIQHAHRQIKEVERLQKLRQSDCQNHIGRPGVLCVQMESESEICLLIGVKGAWCDETTAENSWLAWLWPHLHVSHKRLALIIYFFFFFFPAMFLFWRCAAFMHHALSGAPAAFAALALPLGAWGLLMKGEQAGKLLSLFAFARALKGLQGSQ